MPAVVMQRSDNIGGVLRKPDDAGQRELLIYVLAQKKNGLNITKRLEPHFSFE